MNGINYNNQISIALFEPRIPQNTGNIARTCAAFNLRLHLIEPLGFSLESKLLKRSGLDYWPYMDIRIHPNFYQFHDSLSLNQRIIGLSKSASTHLSEFKFNINDVLLFGREDNGLPNEIINLCNKTLSIPMPGGVIKNNDKGVRSLNLSSSVAIASYQAGVRVGLF